MEFTPIKGRGGPSSADTERAQSLRFSPGLVAGAPVRTLCNSQSGRPYS